MASDILHIKDSYYFEVPKFLLRKNYQDKSEYPRSLDVWVRLDDQFQDWEFERLYEKLAESEKVKGVLPAEEKLHHDWHEWTHHDPTGHGKPADVYLEESARQLIADHMTWQAKPENKDKKIDEYVAAVDHPAEGLMWFVNLYLDADWRNGEWAEAKEHAGGDEAVQQFKNDDSIKWSPEKLAGYNRHLSGKIMIPQPFGTLRNLYQRESGFCISKFMVIEFTVALIVLVAFSWVARRVTSGSAPKGRLWNFLEVFLVFLRDQVVYPSLGGAHHDDHGHGHGHEHEKELKDEPVHGVDATAEAVADAVGGRHRALEHDGHAGHDHYHAPPPHEARRYLPIFWTIFFFVLGCNLFGMLPWMGAPTASLSVTLGLAIVTLLVGMILGIAKFGVGGYLLNQIPGMELPFVIGLVLKPLIFAIEIMGMLIKHGVLSIRLLLNMVAGHLVLLALLGLAFGLSLGLTLPSTPGWQWGLTAVISITAGVLFSVLELFVAFLQAYVFTFLSALFIGAAIHKH
jgi:F-type H+-transporting ATPase subunit a